ncbi:MAG: urea ABC transporter ATP-binding subunit UrtE [Alphaproteobacteria bacterium]|nr:urea ABC transporter ATP-binding subunit UrtE [Alphaproteobacteria bacterium]
MDIEWLLELAGLRTGYGSSPILQGIDLAIRPGEVVAVIGRNGVGKTTLMRCLIGQLRAWAGSIRFRSRDVTGLPPERRAQSGFGYIPQGREVFPRMTVEENLRVGEMIGARTQQKRYDLVYDFFPILAERRHQKAGTLSGGQQQQLAIGRAMVGNPDLLLLDEPSEGVQPSIVEDIARVVQRLNRELGTTVLFVEQNLDMIVSLAQRCYVMDKGQIVAERQHEELQDREIAKRDLQI